MDKRTYRFEVQGKRAVLYLSGESRAPLIVLNSYADDGVEIVRALEEAGSAACDLLVVSGLCWEHDMSPWACPPVFAGGPAYTGGADDYLALLTEQILPRAKAMLPGEPAFTGIAGYSLAGLFALYKY